MVRPPTKDAPAATATDHQSWLGAESNTTAPAPFEVEFDEGDDCVVELPSLGVATGVEGSYDTPFAVAATWKTEPPPYS